MKTPHLLAIGMLAFSQWHAAFAANLDLVITPCFNNAPLVFDALTNQTVSGQVISVTRLDFLLSDISLRHLDGSWVAASNRFAYINARDGRTRVALGNFPAGNFDRIRFHIGVPPEINHADAAQWTGGTPLNPQVNHMYWDWSHEYVFLAFEGDWQNGAQLSGFSYHIVTDSLLMSVELPVTLNVNSDPELVVALDVDKFLPTSIRLNNDTTHSRANDPFASQLRANIQSAFTVIGSGTVQTPRRVHPNLVDATFVQTVVARNATPYRFSYSRFFPRPELPRDNPLTVEGVSLGSSLFFDRRLSGDNSESCATCHQPRAGFAENRRFSSGIGGEMGARNSMPLENLAWKKEFFWDGRATSLREQVLQPIQNPIEMHESLDGLLKKLTPDTNYHRLFANAFGSPEINTDRLARALEQFLLVQVSFDAKFDRVAVGKTAFTAEEQRGYQLFYTEYDPYHGQYGADCFHCHGGALFQSQDFANNGLDARFADVGRYAVTKREGDRGKFSVPSLRNVAVTGPYMHDGRFRTLEEVVEHYCTGTKRSTTLDPNLAKHPDGGIPLSDADKRALVAFLKTLTDDRWLPSRLAAAQ